MHTSEFTLRIFASGALGALVRVLFEDNKLTFPRRVDGGFALGFIGSLLIGGFAGCIIDGSSVTAAMGGFVASSILQNIVPAYGRPSEVE